MLDKSYRALYGLRVMKIYGVLNMAKSKKVAKRCKNDTILGRGRAK